MFTSCIITDVTCGLVTQSWLWLWRQTPRRNVNVYRFFHGLPRSACFINKRNAIYILLYVAERIKDIYVYYLLEIFNDCKNCYICNKIKKKISSLFQQLKKINKCYQKILIVQRNYFWHLIFFFFLCWS